ncbi:MAG: DUF4836 family protein [Bacteroidota bacterium]
MKQKLSGLIIVAAVVFMAACGKKAPSYTQYIPKEASYVVAMDVKSMVGKLEKDSLSVENMLEVLKDSSDPSKYAKAIEMWNQFKDAGLDFENRIYFAVPSVDMNSGNVNIEVVAGLRDEKKLQDFIAKTHNAPKVTKDGDLSYVTIEQMLIGWNKDAVIILGGHTAPNMSGMYPGGADSLSAAVPAPVPGGTASLLADLKKYFALKKDQSMASMDMFTDLVAQKGDVSIFTNSNSLAGSQANPALTMMPKVKELLEGIYSTSIVDFENGKMVMKSQTFVGPKLAEVLKKYAGPTVDMSLVDIYPSNNIGGVAAFSFKPELIPELLKQAGVDALADGFLSQEGLSTNDIIKAFKGDFAIVFSDFGMSAVEKKNPENGVSYTSWQPSGKLVVAVRIGDKVAFEKLLSLSTKAGLMLRNGNRLVPARNGVADTSNSMFIGLENDLLVISNDNTVYDAYIAKKGKIGLSDDARNTMKGSSVAFFMDAQKVLNAIPETMFDTSAMHEKNVLARSKSVFKTMDFTTGNFDGKKIESKGEVIMVSDKNSLPQLVRFLMYAAGEMKMKQAEDSAKWQIDNNDDVDSVATVPVN